MFKKSTLLEKAFLVLLCITLADAVFLVALKTYAVLTHTLIAPPSNAWRILLVLTTMLTLVMCKLSEWSSSTQKE